MTLRHAGCSLALRMRPPAVASVMCIGCVNASGQRSLNTSSSTRLRTQYPVQPDQVGSRAGPEGPLSVRVVNQHLGPVAHFRIALTCHHYLAKKDWSQCTPHVLPTHETYHCANTVLVQVYRYPLLLRASNSATCPASLRQGVISIRLPQLYKRHKSHRDRQ